MTSSEPEVLLSVTMLRPDEKLLLQALRAEGVPTRPVLLEDLAEVVAGHSAPPGLALIRNLSHREAIGVARRLEYVGVETLNRAATIETCNDKGLQALLFAQHGVPHPISRHAYSYAQVRSAVAELGYPAVLKPVSGSWGRGVTRMADEGCVDAWVGGRESADAGGKLFPVLVQEYIDKPGHDLRVVVIGRTPVVAIQRVSDDFRTNTHLGAEVKRVEITDEIFKRCGQVVDALGEGFYGVDLVEDRSTGELMVLEVNANPEFARSSAQHGVNVAGLLAAHVAETYGRTLAPAAA
ncbi:MULTISPECIES: RimK family alpha-L-glutamate ligase [Kitasatospora]|uniref:[lysine-biosynthesis-protein LysW]--L-2-aminoadipate ligase n=2 Tax=Kitasatospora TaxID=2063 RepID=A0ABT1J6X9_9ACTN|nr:RimK family alpha-L-glutamate ligase [Kitasatospora paracochleata]MCP2312979.1 [lysine-biosynthesis-protein LysW]--L-2-aminoadipate ligase [Kitasatospora paracochleata]